jgi:hypothetical protein
MAIVAIATFTAIFLSGILWATSRHAESHH